MQDSGCRALGSRVQELMVRDLGSGLPMKSQAVRQ